MNTILDVAKLAQVSVGTVSHVVNDSTYVSPKLRDRVLKAIRALNYHPNAMARGLRTRLSHSVGMIIPNISDPVFPQCGARRRRCVGSFGLSADPGKL